MPDNPDPDKTELIYDPNAIFHDDGPFDPMFIADAIQAVLRALPLEAGECEAASRRHQSFAMTALAATNPRDPIEVMLAVQAVCAFHAACAAWRIGMNMGSPSGSGTRHTNAAATAARTFDTMLRAIERRQAKPVAVPVGRPAPRVWQRPAAPPFLDTLAQRIRLDDETPPPNPIRRPPNPVSWTPQALGIAKRMEEEARFEADHIGLDLAATEGILPGGGIIMPEFPTPHQQKYIARRLALMYKCEYANNLRKGIKVYPRIRPLRIGDFVP
jgi:hypothetical protein